MTDIYKYRVPTSNDAPKPTTALERLVARFQSPAAIEQIDRLRGGMSLLFVVVILLTVLALGAASLGRYVGNKDATLKSRVLKSRR